MKRPRLPLRAVLVFSAFFQCAAASADTTFWNGFGGSTTEAGGILYGNWTFPGNWTNGIGVNNTLEVIIEESAENAGRILMNRDADGFSDNELWIGHVPSPSKMGSLTLNGGLLQHTDGATNHKVSRIGEGGIGTLKQTGGILLMNSGELRIGNNNTSGGIGLYDLGGGTLSTVQGLYPGGNVMINRNKAPNGGTTARGELRISGNAVVELGAPDTNGAALGFGPGTGAPGSSILSIIGPDATIHMDSITMLTASPFTMTNTSIVRFAFAETGVSTINLTGDFVYDGTNPASAVLSGGVLEIEYTGAGQPASGASFDLMVGDVILNDGSFALDPDAAANWSLALVGTEMPGDGEMDVLRLTFVSGPLPKTHLVAYWPFDADANPQPDRSFFSNNATPNVGATWVMDDERASGAMAFDGNDSFLEALDSESLSLTGDLSIATWVKATDYASTRGLVGKTVANQPASYDLYLNAGSGHASFFAGGASSFTGLNSLTPVPPGEWHHFALTMKNQEVIFYLDGVPDGTGFLLSPLEDSAAPLRIGNRGDLFTDFLGRMDDVAIFDGALTPEQLALVMAGDFSEVGYGSGPFAITDLTYDLEASSVTLTFNSRPGFSYAIDFTSHLTPEGEPGGWAELTDNVPSQGIVTTYTDTEIAGSASVLFYRVRTLP